MIVYCQLNKPEFGRGVNQMQNFGLSMLWFWICYAIVTCVGILHTIFNIYVLKMKPMDENGMGEGYEATKPWHPLYNIILFSLFGWLYMNGLTEQTISEALITGAIWAGIFIFTFQAAFCGVTRSIFGSEKASISY